MDFRPLSLDEKTRLHRALRQNVEGNTIFMDRKDTSFAGTAPGDAVTDEEVITAIRSVPMHYAAIKQQVANAPDDLRKIAERLAEESFRSIGQEILTLADRLEDMIDDSIETTSA